MTREKRQFILKTIRFDVRTLNDIMRVKFVGGQFSLLFEYYLNSHEISKEPGNSGSFARLRTKA